MQEKILMTVERWITETSVSPLVLALGLSALLWLLLAGVLWLALHTLKGPW